MKIRETPDVAASRESNSTEQTEKMKARGQSQPIKRAGAFMLPTPSKYSPTKRISQAKLPTSTASPVFVKARNQPPAGYKTSTEQKVRIPGTPDEELTAQAEEIAATLFNMAYRKLLEMSNAQYEELVDTLMPRTVISPLKLRKAIMEARAKEAVTQSGRYLTSQQLAEVAGLSPTNPSAQPNKWKSAGRIFAVNFKGTDYYPDFGLDPEDNYRPYDGLKPILEVFSNKKSPWKIAFWFQSPNGSLNYRAPQDVLQEDPEQVLAAARDEVQGVQHG